MSFSQAMYSVNEDSGLLQPVLILSNSSETDTTVQVLTVDESATGKICIHNMKLCKYISLSEKKPAHFALKLVFLLLS